MLAMIVVGGEALIDLVPQEADGAWRALPGGSPANTALALARLGHETAFLSRLSWDAFGQAVRARLAESGVRLDHVVEATEPSTLAVVTMGDDGAATYTFYVTGTSGFTWPTEGRPVLPDGCTAVHVGSLAAVLEPAASVYDALVRTASPRTVRSFDPNVRPALDVGREAYRERMERWVATSDVVRASDEDLAWLYPDEAPLASARRWTALGPAVVVVTRGAAGVTGFAGGDEVTVPAARVEVVDTVGAGDSFMAALLGSLAERDALDRVRLAELRPDALAGCLRYASAVAAVTCGRAGADPPWRHEIDAGVEELRG